MPDTCLTLVQSRKIINCAYFKKTSLVEATIMSTSQEERVGSLHSRSLDVSQGVGSDLTKPRGFYVHIHMMLEYTAKAQ